LSAQRPPADHTIVDDGDNEEFATGSVWISIAQAVFCHARPVCRTVVDDHACGKLSDDCQTHRTDIDDRQAVLLV
jgi:hypothetical protein